MGDDTGRVGGSSWGSTCDPPFSGSNNNWYSSEANPGCCIHSGPGGVEHPDGGGGAIKDPSPESRTPSGGTEVPQVLLCAASETAAVRRVRGRTAAVALRSLGRKLRAGVEPGVLRVSLKHVQELPLLQPP